MTLTLKHIAQEFELDPYPLRQALRASLPHHLANRRWSWPDADDPDYKRARNVASELSKKRGRSLSSSASTSPEDASPATPTPLPRESSSHRGSGASLSRKSSIRSPKKSNGAASTSSSSKKGSTS